MVDDVATRLEQQQVVKGLQQGATIGLTNVDALSLHAPAFKAVSTQGCHDMVRSSWLKHNNSQVS